MKKNTTISIWALALLGSLAFPACGGPANGKQGEDFISDDPATQGGGDTDNGGTFSTGAGEDGGGTATGDGGDESGGDDGNEGGGDAVEVLEADIIQMEDDTLYALSRYSGLSVVDMSDPDDLDILGAWETDAEPFEMYVDQGQAFVMFNDYYTWDWDDQYGELVEHSTSRLVALDASNPADVVLRGEFTLAGRIQDSRRVGDILYVVTLQDGYCWNCDENQNTRITSLDISNPAQPQIIDVLVFEAPDDNWDWQRSVESTTERMYVAARSSWGEGQGSFIDVVDISAGDGSLTQGAQVQVDGDVFSRWQMDEHEGVLRVISQYPSTIVNPKIETFTIESSDSFVPLGEGELQLPEPESLRSVRFDGDKGYAITAEQTDPLFTVDLSDPANPHQVGELEIPGWVYHMETRDDRILALGFDQAHPEGSINVSLFDVSVFDDPTLVRRVHFGGDWANFAEDQNRIHKAFTILDDEQMILVPFSGWIGADDGEGGEFCHGQYGSGVQIVDWANDDLTLRGLVPARGQARRAFTHRDRIVAVSDTQVATFEYGDRDMPTAADQAALAVQVDNLVKAGDHWVRLARDWYDSRQILEIVDGTDPGAPEPVGTIELDIAEEGCEYSDVREVYANGDRVFVLYTIYGENFSDGYYDWYEKVRIVSIDISNPATPFVQDVLDIDAFPGDGYTNLANVAINSSWAVQHDDRLVLLLRDGWGEDGEEPITRVEVIDLSNPEGLEVLTTLERPEGQTQGSLSVFSDTVVSWHTEPVQGQPGKVRFYLDRLDLDGTPEWKTKINVPGVVVAYDADASRAYTVDFVITETQDIYDNCQGDPKFFNFIWPDDYDWEFNEPGTCQFIDRTLKRVAISGNGATLEQVVDIEGDRGLRSLEATQTRIFAHRFDYEPMMYEDGYIDYVPHGELVVADISNNETNLEVFDGEGYGYWWDISATRGERAVVRQDYGQLSLIDATDMADIEITTSSLPGYYGCWNPVIGENEVYCPMGSAGLETVEW